MAALPDFPSDADGQAAAEYGEALVLKYVGDAARERLRNGAHASDTMLLFVGAMVGAAKGLTTAFVNDRPPDWAESLALAYARAALRGGSGPINDDGSPWSSGSQ